MYKRNGIETIVNSDGILWLNEKRIEGLDHKKLRVTRVKHPSVYRKHWYELVDEPKKKQVNRILIHKELVTKVFIDCRTKAAHNFRTRLGFK